MTSKDKKAEKVGEATPIRLGETKFNTEAYNCISHVFCNSEGDPEQRSILLPKWDNDVQNNLEDYVELKWDDKNVVGDIILYGSWDDKEGKLLFNHVAKVIEVDDDGFTTRVESKLGEKELVQHHPRSPIMQRENYGGPLPTVKGIDGKDHYVRIYMRSKKMTRKLKRKAKRQH